MVTEGQTHRHTHKATAVTLATHACRGLIMHTYMYTIYNKNVHVYTCTCTCTNVGKLFLHCFGIPCKKNHHD